MEIALLFQAEKNLLNMKKNRLGNKQGVGVGENLRIYEDRLPWDNLDCGGRTIQICCIFSRRVSTAFE